MGGQEVVGASLLKDATRSTLPASRVIDVHAGDGSPMRDHRLPKMFSLSKKTRFRFCASRKSLL
jgi:hypothetical protein